MLDADKYEIGANRDAKELNDAAMRQSDLAPAPAIHPDQIESRTALRVPRASGSRSAPTSTRSRPATGAAGRSSTDVTLTVELRGRGATVTVYKSMANGRSQRVDSASTGDRGRGRRFAFDLSLKPFVDGGWYWYDVVAGDEDVVVESAEWTAEVPEDRAAARHRRPRDHDDEPPGLLRQAARPDRRRRAAAPLPRQVFVMEQGTQKVVDSPSFAEGRGGARRHAAGHRAGQPRRLRRLRPRPARVGPQGHRDVRDDDGRRRRLRARGHHPGDHLRRPGPPPDHRRRPHVQPLLPLAAAQLRRDHPALALLVAVAARRLQRLGLRRPQPALGALAAQARRRRLQRLVHVPDPAPGAGRDRAVAAALHQVGRLRVRPARQGGRLPDGDASRAPRSGTCRGPTRTTRSTGRPTSTSATASSRRCCTRRTPRAAG